MHDIIIIIIQGILRYRFTSEPQRERKKKKLLMCMISQGLNEVKHSEQKQFFLNVFAKKILSNLCEIT